MPTKAIEPDADWIIRADVLGALRVLVARHLTFDYVGILPRHLEHVPLIAQHVPDLRIVIDHLGNRRLPPDNRALELTACPSCPDAECLRQSVGSRCRRR